MKKNIALLLAFVLSLGLVACSKSVPEPEPQAPKELRVADLRATQDTDQLVLVDVMGPTDATLTLYMKQANEDGSVAWAPALKTNAKIGKNGLGKTMAGDGKTPVGVFTFTEAFGVANNPGTALTYTKLNKNHYWNGDPKSREFNTLVNAKKVKRFAKKQSEQLSKKPVAYQYAAVLSYNQERTPEAGPTVFLHCVEEDLPTEGGVAIAEPEMKLLLAQLKPGAKILIAAHDELASY